MPQSGHSIMVVPGSSVGSAAAQAAVNDARGLSHLAGVPGGEPPGTDPETPAMRHAQHIALWGVTASGDISGSSDSSIQNAVPNDLSPILNAAKIQAVFCNGTTASRLYERYLLPVTGMQAVRLPSTSPANARSSVQALTERWRAALAPWL